MGKSTQLLQIAHNYKESGLHVAIYTAAIDDRVSKGVVASRLGASAPAHVFDADTNFLDELRRPDNAGVACILVDEAQFTSKEQVVQLHQIAALHDVPVICFGLRTDYRGEPFSGSTHLLALAEDLQEMKAICKCGKKSTMNARIDSRGNRVSVGPQILIGGNGCYRQVCARCFYMDAFSPNGPIPSIANTPGKSDVGCVGASE